MEPGARSPSVGSRSPHSRGPLGPEAKPSCPGTTLPCCACAQHRSTAGSCWPPRGGLCWACPRPSSQLSCADPRARALGLACPLSGPLCSEEGLGSVSAREHMPTHQRRGQDALEHTGSISNQTPRIHSPASSPDASPRACLLFRVPLTCTPVRRSRTTHCTGPPTRAAERHAQGAHSASAAACRRVTAAPCLSRPSPPGAFPPRQAPRARPSLLLLVQAPGKHFLEELCSGLWGPRSHCNHETLSLPLGTLTSSLPYIYFCFYLNVLISSDHL